MTKHLLPFAALLFAIPVLAQDGQLDADFSADGMQFTAAGPYLAEAFDVVQLPNGYLLVAGNAMAAMSDDGIAVVKYVPDGELDASFGNAGIVYMEPGTGHQYCYAMAVQDDGKIIVTGATQESFAQQHVLLVRLNADGTPDMDFADAGIARIPLGTGSATGYDVSILTNGKIAVAGTVVNGGNSDLFILQLNSDGALDTDFGSNSGFSLLDLGSSDSGLAMDIDGSGNFIVAGTTTGLDGLVARFLPDGTLDSTFGTDGHSVLALDLSSLRMGMVVQQDRILLCGPFGAGIAFGGLNSDGSFDTTIGPDGITGIDSDGYNLNAYTMALQADGKLLFAGKGEDSALLYRYELGSGGDPTFGTGGIVINGAASTTASAVNKVLVQADNRIVVVGRAIRDGKQKFYVARHLSGSGTGVQEGGTDALATRFFPNPVSGKGTLSFTLPLADRLSAVLYDVQGRVVRNLFSDEQFAAGSQRRELDLSGLAPGAYQVVITGSSKVTSLPLITY